MDIELDMRKISIAAFIVLVVVAGAIVFIAIPANQAQMPTEEDEEKPFTATFNTLPEVSTQPAPFVQDYIVTQYIRDGVVVHRGLFGPANGAYTVQIINQDDELHVIQIEDENLLMVESGKSLELEITDSHPRYTNIICHSCVGGRGIFTTWRVPDEEMTIASIHYDDEKGFSTDRIKVLQDEEPAEREAVSVMLLVWNKSSDDISVVLTPNIVDTNELVGAETQTTPIPAGAEYPLMPILNKNIEFVYQCGGACPGEINEGRIVVR